MASTNNYKVYTPKVKQVKVEKAPDIPEYEGVKYNDSYRNNVDTTFYNNSIDKYRDYAEQQRANQLGQAQKTQQSALRQAYVTRMQNQKNLNDNLARQGIRGGASETANMRLMNQYGQARQAANTDYSNSVNSINQAIDQNIFDYTSDMESRAEQYRQNMAQSMWQADREDYSNNWQAQNDKAWNIWNAQNEANATNTAAINQQRINAANAKTEKSANIMNITREDQEKDTTYYANFYSKSGKKSIQSAISTAKKKIASLDRQIKAAQKKGQAKKVTALKAKRAAQVAKRNGAAQALANKE